ncbi:MAG: acyl-CoA dehydratase activase [Rhodospirillales bacterium]|nr:acyl-CoA dehydratase activase [Rhodospirillales bacterium]MCW8953157.1 acyl-CoA dehydratase activase [Rhodospirillales bacterium]MCW9002421.1 acyl-CoA dehydratase activase [Rhodospirillales bacterium]
MTYYAGIDIGSATTKVAVIDDKAILGHRVAPTGVHCEETAQQILADLSRELGLAEGAIQYITSTGYGRRLVKFANSTISEISANVKGATWYGAQDGITVRTIINIGGQDSKVIALDDHGVTKNFAMNDKCAAGTGRFLETLCRIMEINVTEMGDISLHSTVPIRINSTCAVFAESEIISLLARRKEKADIIAGAHYSIANRIARMVKRVGLKETVFFDGGPALNSGLKKALEDELVTDLYVPPKVPQVTTAVGAALIAREERLTGVKIEAQSA